MNKNIIIKDFISHFESSNFDQLKLLLNENIICHVTSPDGNTFQLTGRDSYIENLKKMKTVPLDSLRVKPTQIHSIDKNNFLVMIKINAKKPTMTLNNFATFFIRFDGQLISEIHMVEAKPYESSEFWK